MTLHFPRWKIWLVLATVLVTFVLASPNVLPPQGRWQEYLPSKKVNLGLDLRGGSYLLLEVDVVSHTREQLLNLLDDARIALRKEKVGYTELRLDNDKVRLTLRDPQQVELMRKQLRGIDPALEIESLGGEAYAVRYPESAGKELRRRLIDQSIEIVNRRINETGTREPIIQRQGDSRILVQVPGLADPAQLKEILGRTAKMTFHLVDTTASAEAVKADPSQLPPDALVMPSDETDARDPSAPPHSYVVKKRAILSGDLLTQADATMDNTGRAVVNFRFNNLGARKFGEVTQQNVGKPFAIVLDGKVISAPVIREPILGGSGQISGNFTVESANNLAILLRAGALPAPLKIIEERTVGPSLGSDSIAAGKIACLVGLVMVMAFMVVSYGLFGIFANIALLFNMVALLAMLSLFQATLTLPGIAGIVLTMGMAVDANVLIYERIREEIRIGKSPIASVDAGYSRAFATILDANITTLIAALLLFEFGSGSVKGFAVTLALGILTSMFTAVTLNRLIVALWIDRRRPNRIPI